MKVIPKVQLPQAPLAMGDGKVHTQVSDEEQPFTNKAKPRTKPELRFKVGHRVECNVKEGYMPGKVIRLWYEENGEIHWSIPLGPSQLLTLPSVPPLSGQFAPYQIQLDKGGLIYAPEDTDKFIRKTNTRIPLRFDVGERVECNMSHSWEPGRVIRVWYSLNPSELLQEKDDLEETHYIYDGVVPYQVQLDNGVDIFCKADENISIRQLRPCSHGYPDIPPNNFAGIIAYTFEKTAQINRINIDGNLAKFSSFFTCVHEGMSPKIDDLWNDPVNSKNLRSCLISLGTEYLLNGEVGIAIALALVIIMLEGNEVASKQIANIHLTMSKATATKMRDMAGGGDQAATQFYARRTACHCLQEKYKQSRLMPKIGRCTYLQCKKRAEQILRSDLLLCGNCRMGQYCGKACQEADWPHHKKSCVYHHMSEKT